MTPAVRAFVLALIQSVEALQEHIVQLNTRIVELESQVKRLTPQNSSIPPSTVHPHGKPPTNKPKSSRNHGGQKGHKRHQRVLVPSEQCNEVIPLIPSVCRNCQEPLVGEDHSPLRHQVYELPPIVPIITEYQQHRLLCPKCGTKTCGQLPNGVPAGQSGPRLMALTALLMGHFRQSKRLTSEFLTDLLNIPCCPSLTVKIQKHVSKALADPHEELRAALSEEFNVHMDETPTKEGSSKAWLWTAVTNSVVLFAVFSTRAATAITSLLGENFQGIINCDRAKMYYMAKHLQWCWAHLIRDIQAMIDSKVPDRVELGSKLMKELKVIFHRWHRYKSEEISWQEFQLPAAVIATKINQLLYEGTGSHDSKLRNQCQSLYTHREHLWRFITVQGIEPTNNCAERALRGAVIYRKLSFGTQSEAGSRFVERIFSVAATCRLQKRNVFTFLVQAIEAKLSNRDAPKLLTSP